MTDWGQFEKSVAANDQRLTECELCEAMCPDAVDGTLTETERKLFDRHVAACTACAQEFEEAQRGAAWLGILKGHTPEPPTELLARILAETTAHEQAHAQPDAVPHTSVATPARTPEWTASAAPAPVAVPVPAPAPAWALSALLRKGFGALRLGGGNPSFQPRLAMTAAMAFFSIALTLSMTGVRLQEMHWSDLTPSGLRRTVTNASASAERSFQNMRVVYQVESRVSEMRGEGPLAARDVQYSEPAAQPAAPANKPANRNAEPPDNGAHYKPL